MYNKEPICQSFGRNSGPEDKRCPHYGCQTKKSPFPLFLIFMVISIFMLSSFLCACGTAGPSSNSEKPAAKLQKGADSPDDSAAVESSGIPIEFEREDYEYYTLPRKEMEPLEEGFWNQEIQWDTAYPSLSEAQKQAMQKLGEEMAWEGLSQPDALELLEDQGCSDSEAREILDVSRIDWNKQALRKCLTHLSTSAVSKNEMEHHLKSCGFTDKQVRHALLNCGADWKDQAVIAAKEHFSYTGDSRLGAIDFLVHFGYPREDAAYAVDLCGRDFDQEAIRKGLQYLQAGKCGYDCVVRSLENHKFTHDQAVNAAFTLGLQPDDE